MKKISKLLMLISAGTLLALGSCAGGNTENSAKPTESTDTTASAAESSEPKTATRIKHDEIPYMEEGVVLDLDKYVSIEYGDGSTDKNYEISCSKSALKIVEGTHKIKSDVTDTYTIVVKAGPLTTKLTIEVLSNDQLKLMQFLAPLEENPRNYTIDLSADDEYYWSYYHNERYTGIWDKNNPAKTVDDPTSDSYGEPNSTILAQLSDGNAYWGSVGTDAAGNPKAQFEPGPVKNWDWYYFTMDLTLDASDSAWTTYEGEDVLMLGPTFCQNLLNYGCSQLPERNGYDYYGAVVVDYIDINIDGNPDKYVFDCLVSNGTQIGTYCTITLYDIGTTNPAIMSAALNDASYVPEAITANEITTAFSAINTTGNYTATLKAWSRSGSSSMTPYTPAESAVPEDGCANIFGTTDYVVTQKVTAAGIYTEEKGKKLNQTSAGYAPDAAYSLTNVSAVYNAGNKAYSAKLDTTDGSATNGQIPAATEITGTTNVFSLAKVQSMTAGAITAASVNSTVWTGKSTSGSNVVLAGNVGDNDGASTHENALFEELLNMFGNDTYGVLNSMGTTWTKAEEFSQGDKHALSLYCDYSSFTVNTTTNEISIVFDMYAPIGLTNGYFGMSITIDHIGTTSFDFSTLTAGVAAPGLLA